MCPPNAASPLQNGTAIAAPLSPQVTCAFSPAFPPALRACSSATRVTAPLPISQWIGPGGCRPAPIRKNPRRSPIKPLEQILATHRPQAIDHLRERVGAIQAADQQRV